MDSSLSRLTNFPPSIIPDRPLHRLTESMTRDLSAVVTSMLPALPTESWLASEAYRRQMRRGRKWRRSLPRRGSLHSTRRPRRGEVKCRRAELSIGGACAVGLCDFSQVASAVSGLPKENLPACSVLNPNCPMEAEIDCKMQSNSRWAAKYAANAQGG